VLIIIGRGLPIHAASGAGKSLCSTCAPICSFSSHGPRDRIWSCTFLTQVQHATLLPSLYHAHVARNRDPILEVLRRMLPAQGLVLEVASGSGEHAAYFAKRLPTLLWQPTDPDPRSLASIAAHRTAANAPNLLSPLWLDARSAWPVQRADALVCINMIHITPWAACKGLMTGAERALRSGGVLYLYLGADEVRFSCFSYRGCCSHDRIRYRFNRRDAALCCCVFR